MAFTYSQHRLGMSNLFYNVGHIQSTLILSEVKLALSVGVKNFYYIFIHKYAISMICLSF